VSCYYDLWCKTCEVGAGLDLNKAEWRAQALLSERAALEALSEGAIAAYVDAASGIPDTRPLRFFPAHRGHVIVVRDEYGRESEPKPQDVPTHDPPSVTAEKP
jgi:hypothetical protein